MKKDISKMRPHSADRGLRKRSFCFYCGLLTIAAGLLFFAFGCAIVHNPTVQKNESASIDSKEEVQIGRSMAENIIKTKIPLLKDPAKQLYVNQIGNRIAQVCDRRDIMYHFAVLDSPDLNAFALPGGYVYIYSGLLIKLDEAELAAMLAHEVGHVAAKHAVKKMRSALGDEFLLVLAMAGFDSKDPAWAQQISKVSSTVFDLLSRGYSREDELLADQLALNYLKGAGYDSFGLVRVLEFLKSEAGPSGRVFETLSSPVRLEERIKKLKRR
jgi:predicted Zn-dependent protease